MALTFPFMLLTISHTYVQNMEVSKVSSLHNICFPSIVLSVTEGLIVKLQVHFSVQ